MDSDDDTRDNDDSGNVSSGDDDFPMEEDINSTKERTLEPEDYPYEVLTTEEIVQHMVDCIKEVHNVIEVIDSILLLFCFVINFFCFEINSFGFVCVCVWDLTEFLE